MDKGTGTEKQGRINTGTKGQEWRDSNILTCRGTGTNTNIIQEIVLPLIG